MKLSRLTGLLEQMVPACFAESYDNVGLLCGDPAARVSRILLTVDVTPAVLDEAKRRKAQMILSHHPPIFGKLSRLVNGDGQNGLLYKAIRSGVALYAMHTNLDSIEGGINSALAEMVGITGDVQPLRLARTGANYKLVVFVPADSVDRLSDALFSAGAGRIGHQHRYSECSFCSGGVGTFHGDESTSPAVGRAGRREYVQELRLETIVPAGDLPEVLSAVRSAHPYEEPAYDLIPLEPLDDRVGLGRVGELSRPVTAATLIARIKKGLGIKTLQLIGSPRQKVSMAAVSSGSLGDLLGEVFKSEAQFLLTGEIKHHQTLEATQQGLVVALAGHWSSERPGMIKLAGQLKSALPDIAVLLSTADKEPIFTC